MANINVKNDDRRKEEEHVMRSYGVESTRSVHEGSGGDRSGPYQRSSKHGSETEGGIYDESNASAGGRHKFYPL